MAATPHIWEPRLEFVRASWDSARVLGRYLAAMTVFGLLGACTGPEKGPCADTQQVLALPTPLWQEGPALSIPVGDRAAAALSAVRRRWASQLSKVDGWPVRPTVLVPLSAPASGIDARHIQVYVADEQGPLSRIDIEFEADLVAAQTLRWMPQGPLPPAAREVVLVFEPGAVQGALPLPACEDSGPHPAYREARQALPEEQPVELALPFRISRIPDELVDHAMALRQEPDLAVRSLDSVEIGSFGAASPTATVAAHLHPQGASGVLQTPDYRSPNGTIENPQGAFIKQGVTEPGVLVLRPAQGQAPFPFVLFQHGGGQDRTEVFKVAGPLSEAGFALVAIDLPYHGARAAPGGGDDLDMLDFDSPLRTRDNFRQAVSDHLSVLGGLEALNSELEPIWGHTQTLDPSRAFYMGLSMGAVSGSLTFSAGPNLQGAALFVGGADLATLLSSGFFSLFVSDVLEQPAAERAAILGLLQTLLNGMDPIAYGPRVEDRSLAPRPALFMQAADDPLIGEASSDLWAHSFGADLVQPSTHPVAHMQSQTLPAQDNLTWPSGAGTRLLFQHPMQQIPVRERHAGLIRTSYAQQIVAHCFMTQITTGACEALGFDFQTR